MVYICVRYLPRVYEVSYVGGSLGRATIGQISHRREQRQADSVRVKVVLRDACAKHEYTGEGM